MPESKRPPLSDSLEAARGSLRRLKAARDWNEETPVVHLTVQQAAAAKRSPLPPAPPPPPGTLQIVLQFAGGAVQRMPAWGVVVVAVVAIAAWAYLAVHGKAPVP